MQNKGKENYTAQEITSNKTTRKKQCKWV